MQSADAQVDTQSGLPLALWQFPTILELWCKKTDWVVKHVELLWVMVVDRLESCEVFQ